MTGKKLVLQLQWPDVNEWEWWNRIEHTVTAGHGRVFIWETLTVVATHE